MASFSSLPELPQAVAYLGAVTASYLTLRLAVGVWPFLRSSPFTRYAPPSDSSSSESNSSKPHWALVTGASDGIGRAAAHELLRRGFNVILHGRNKSKLDKIAETFKAELPKRQTRLFIADTTAAATYARGSSNSNNGAEESPIEAYARSLHEEGVQLTVLINNVGGLGFLARVYSFLDAQSAVDVDQILDCNIRFTVHLTRALLPAMKAHGRPALVVNAGSLAGDGYPLLSVYSGTKAFITGFTKGLALELALPSTATTTSTTSGGNIRIQAWTIGSVLTSQYVDAKPSLFSPLPDSFARASLPRLGGPEPVITAYWPHALQGWLFHVLNESVYGKVVSGVVKGLHEAEAKTL